MRKRWFFLFLLCPMLLGMGSAPGDAPPDKIPQPMKNFNATFTDQTDVVTECSHVSIDGAVYLEGKRGEGAFTVSFDNIREVHFRQQGEKLQGVVKLNDGQTVELVLKKDRKAFGRTRYGTFQIRLGELKRLIFR